MLLLITILCISLLIILHEVGHYAFAKLFGMRVLRFSLGLGPALVSKKLGETIWQVGALPFGGFVQVDGMAPEEVGEVVDPHNYRARPRWQRALFLAAGPGANWLLTIVFITLLLGTIGLEQLDTTQPTTIGRVAVGSPAESAGLQVGDRIVSINNVTVSSFRDLIGVIQDVGVRAMPVVVERAGISQTLTVVPRPRQSGEGFEVGLEQKTTLLRMGPLDALKGGVRGSWNMATDILDLLWGAVRGRGDATFVGIPKIVSMVSEQARQGLGRLFQTLASLSMSLALLNLLPVPALDGARIFLLGVEAVRRRPINPRIETWVHGIGFLVLLALMAALSIRDLL